MKIICSRCEKEIEDASPYNFYVLHKECFREHAEVLIDEFFEDLKDLRKYPYLLRSKEIKWEAKKNE